MTDRTVLQSSPELHTVFWPTVLLFFLCRRWSYLGGHISTVLYEYVASQAENKNVTTFGLYTLRTTNAIISM